MHFKAMKKSLIQPGYGFQGLLDQHMMYLLFIIYFYSVYCCNSQLIISSRKLHN